MSVAGTYYCTGVGRGGVKTHMLVYQLFGKRPIGHLRFCEPFLLSALLLSGGCTGDVTDPPPDPTPPPVTNCEVPRQTLVGRGAAVWSATELVPNALEYQAVRPNLAVANQTVYMAFEVQTKRPEDRFTTPVDIYTIERRGGVWSNPVNISRSATPPSGPTVGVGLDGTVHVVWGEKSDGDPETPPNLPTSMFYANNESGEWSSPDTLWFSRNKSGFTLPRRPVIGPGGELHLVFSRAIEEYPANLHLTRIGGTWSESRQVPGRGFPDLAVDGTGRMLLAFIMPDTSAEANASGLDINSVFVTTSNDAGATWAPASRVLRSGVNRSYAPRLTIGGDRTIHLLWIRDMNGDIWPDIIQHSYSRDGVCWSVPTTLPTPSGIPEPPEVAADDAGGLHLVFSHSAGLFDPARALYLYWDGDSWSEPEQLFGSANVGQVLSLYRDEAGVLHFAVTADVDGVRGIHYTTGRAGGER